MKTKKLKSKPATSANPKASAELRSKDGLGSDGERQAISKINAAKKGCLIKLRCWTEATQSASETHAKSITAAVDFIRKSSQFHANWSMEFRSEPNNQAQRPPAE